MNVRVVADAALPRCIDEADLILVTAATIRAGGALVPVGTSGLAAVAKEMQKPVHLVGGVLKIQPECAPLSGLPPMGKPEDLWEDAPEGVTVESHRYEMVPLSAFKAVVQESGIVQSFEVEQRVREMPVPGWIDGAAE